jgi:hypothetical protein
MRDLTTAQRGSLAGVLAAALGLLAAGSAFAQGAGGARDLGTPVVRGWLFTPSIGYGLTWDDNVLLQGEGDDKQADLLNAVTPRAAANYRSKWTTLSASYQGTVLIYRSTSDLNSYDQRAAVNGRRVLSSRYAIFAENSFALTPTTELQEFVAVPFVRTGSRIDSARAGVEARLSKMSSLTGTYTFHWVDFDNPLNDPLTPLRGGHGNGASAAYRHTLDQRTSIVADYDYEHARIGVGFDTFNIHNASAGIERRQTPEFSYYASFGISRLGVTTIGEPQNGPLWRAGVIRQFERASVSGSYHQSFVPAYGFGGTVQNQEVVARAQAPLARRLTGQTSVAWRRNEALIGPNEALIDGQPSLWSWWFEGGVGYMLNPWLHLDANYATNRQTIDRPGGHVVRNRVSVALSTGRPMRIH